MKLILLAAMVLAPFCLALGIVLPLARFETLYVFNREPSLVDIVMSLFRDGDYALAAVVFLVSIVFPILKMLVVMARPLGIVPEGGWSARLLPQLARWSLMDVLLVALVIVAAKTGGIATALSQPGLWFYAASALMAVVAHVLGERMGRQAGTPMPAETETARP
jgi:paraquat-inducible protein A